MCIRDRFYREVLIYFNQCKKNSHLQDMNKNEILQEPIWNNKLFLFKGQPIYFKNWVNNIKYMYVKDLFTENGFKTIEEVSREICTNTNILCDFKIIKKVFRYTRKIIAGQESKFINIKK